MQTGRPEATSHNDRSMLASWPASPSGFISFCFETSKIGVGQSLAFLFAVHPAPNEAFLSHWQFATSEAAAQVARSLQHLVANSCKQLTICNAAQKRHRILPAPQMHVLAHSQGMLPLPVFAQGQTWLRQGQIHTGYRTQPDFHCWAEECTRELTVQAGKPETPGQLFSLLICHPWSREASEIDGLSKPSSIAQMHIAISPEKLCLRSPGKAPICPVPEPNMSSNGHRQLLATPQICSLSSTMKLEFVQSCCCHTSSLPYMLTGCLKQIWVGPGRVRSSPRNHPKWWTGLVRVEQGAGHHFHQVSGFGGDNFCNTKYCDPEECLQPRINFRCVCR